MNIKNYINKHQAYFTKQNITIAAVTLVLLILLPVTVVMNSDQKNQSINAAGAANVEAEAGTFAGNVSIINDVNASGGEYVRLGTLSSITPTPTPNAGSLIFSSSFETDDLSEWADNQSCPTGVTIVTNPVRSGQYAAKFTVADDDTNAKCPNVPTNNPRAQLVSNALFHDGDDYYIGFSTFFPTDFPTITDWFVFSEIYGPPFGGSPTMQFAVDGNNIVFARDSTHNYDRPWTSGPITKGTAWEDFVIHVKFSTDPAVGFVEIWNNGVQQTFTNGTKKLFYATLVPGNNWQTGGYNAMFINQYRSATTPLGTVTIYHDDVRVGTTYASVAR